VISNSHFCLHPIGGLNSRGLIYAATYSIMPFIVCYTLDKRQLISFLPWCTTVHIIITAGAFSKGMVSVSGQSLMAYQWDRNKARANFLKHGVHFADAVSVFADDMAVTIEDDHPGEERLVTLGTDALGRILAVVFTWRGDVIRIISARKATKQERKQYEG
jgi:uncharacterized protein